MSVELTDRLRIRSASAIPKTCEKKAVAFETFGRQLIGQQLDPVWPGQINPIVARLSGGLKFCGPFLQRSRCVLAHAWFR